MKVIMLSLFIIFTSYSFSYSADYYLNAPNLCEPIPYQEFSNHDDLLQQLSEEVKYRCSKIYTCTSYAQYLFDWLCQELASGELCRKNLVPIVPFICKWLFYNRVQDQSKKNFKFLQPLKLKEFRIWHLIIIQL